MPRRVVPVHEGGGWHASPRVGTWSVARERPHDNLKRAGHRYYYYVLVPDVWTATVVSHEDGGVHAHVPDDMVVLSAAVLPAAAGPPLGPFLGCLRPVCRCV